MTRTTLRLVSSLSEAEIAERAVASRRHRPTRQQRAEFAKISRQWRERATHEGTHT